MALYPCLSCGTPSAGRRCTRCGGAGRPIDTRRAYDDPAYRRARAHLIATATTCHLCGEPFTEGDPPTADHVTPLADGGHAAGPIKPAHRSCNGRRGAAPLAHAGRPGIM